MKPGPRKGSEGAKRIGDAHRGSHPHDKTGGFAANPELARVAGQKGGLASVRKYGKEHFRKCGLIGGRKLSQIKGREYFASIGRLGALAKQRNRAAASEMKKDCDDCPLVNASGPFVACAYAEAVFVARHEMPAPGTCEARKKHERRTE